jgi:adenosylmethionine-8-amino-7-oxononanoate aminotransferase
MRARVSSPCVALFAEVIPVPEVYFRYIDDSTGSEAMEAVIKLARQYWFEQKQPQRKNFIARHLSFHGNTVATLSLAYHAARRAPYEVILDHDNFFHVSPAYYKRFGKQGESEEEYVQRLVNELEDKILKLGPETVAGFVAETVVGATTGAVPAPKGYFKAMREVCDKYGVLFILDEVMSGMGRRSLQLAVRHLTNNSHRQSGRYGYPACMGEFWRQHTSGYPSCCEGSRRGVCSFPAFYL